MNTDAMRNDWVGQLVDERFPLIQWLGGSEGGDVFLTELRDDRSRNAAIKLIPAGAKDAETHLAAWAVTPTLSHPHLMRVFHTGRCEISGASLLYVVTEYAGEVLSQILPERPLTPDETREMLGPVLDTLSYLHAKGVVHGHLKPSNILVVDDKLKLSSDSLHLAGASSKPVSAPGIHDAPETATGAVTPASDVWALGVNLVETLTQHPPVWDRSTQSDPVVPQSIPEPFAGIAKECLRSDPARRCTLGEIKARLQPPQPPQPLPEPADETPGTTPANFRRPTLIAAALVLVAVAAILLVRSQRTPAPLPTEEQQSAPAAAAVSPQPQSPAPKTHASHGAVVKGTVVDRVLPDVLPSASATIRGQVNVKIRVDVGPDGEVTNADFDSPGSSRYFSKVALQAAQHWKFTPAQMRGRAVSSVWVLHFKFKQNSTDVAPVEVSP